MDIRFLALLTLVSIASQTGSSYVNKLVTFNAGLVHTIPLAEERKNKMIKRLSDMDSNVICLQEIYNSVDVRDIVSSLEVAFPFTYSSLHSKDGKLKSRLSFPPCSLRNVLTIVCVLLKCNIAQPVETLLKCAIQTCNTWLHLNQKSLTCIIVGGVRNIIRCFLSIVNKMNIPGLLLLSKTPLRNRKTVSFIPGIKQLFPKSMLIADIDRLGTIACTHLTTDLGSPYFEPALQKMFSSWAQQNTFESQFIINYSKSYSNVIVMGDLNTGPEIENKSIHAEIEESYNAFVANGYTSPYVSLVGKETYSDENYMTSRKLIIDHILFKGKNRTFDAKRILDVGGPFSDHFGVEVFLVKDIQSSSK